MQACANITKAQKHTNTHTHISVSKTDIYPYIRHPCLRTSRLQRSQGAIKAGSQFFRKSRSAAIMDIMSACFFARTRHTTESRSKSVWIKPQSLGTSGETPVLALPALPNPAIETPEVTGTGCHAEDSNLMTFSTEFPRVNSSSQFFWVYPKTDQGPSCKKEPVFAFAGYITHYPKKRMPQNTWQKLHRNPMSTDSFMLQGIDQFITSKDWPTSCTMSHFVHVLCLSHVVWNHPDSLSDMNNFDTSILLTDNAFLSSNSQIIY